MNKEELKALEMVIEYLAEEKADYENFVEMGGDPTKHIYTHIQTLKNYIKGEQR